MNDSTQLPLDLEIWMPIPGYEGLYDVSSKGSIRRAPENARFKTKPIRKLTITKFGYQSVYIKNTEGQGKNLLVHRAVMAAFVGPVPDGHQINHKNGIKSDNRIENLEYITPSANVQHAYDVLGVVARHGVSHPCAKLNDEKVREIRQLIGRRSLNQLSKQFSVDNRVIRDIRDHKIWKHVK